MIQHEVRHNNRLVVISEYSPTRFEARLYVNGGETVTTTCWKGKTRTGAERWAQQVLTS